MNNLDETLRSRGKKYGDFKTQAYSSQKLKQCMQSSNGWVSLSSDKREALEMIAHKIARILNGDPEYLDSWHDISGYATLIEKSLEGNK